MNTTNTDYAFLNNEVVEGGMLNEQGVMNVSLSFFDITRSLINDSTEKEVILFRQALSNAKVFCASMSDWSFLIKTVEYDEDDVTNSEEEDGETVYTKYKNYLYGYRLPNDFLKVKYVNGDTRIGFAVKGNEVYCNFLGCSVDYLSSDLKNLPMDFGYLVAYKCAIDIAQHLDPEGTAMARASNMLQQTFTVLKQRDDMNFKLQNPAQNHYINRNTAYWGYGGHRK